MDAGAAARQVALGEARAAVSSSLELISNEHTVLVARLKEETAKVSKVVGQVRADVDAVRRDAEASQQGSAQFSAQVNKYMSLITGIGRLTAERRELESKREYMQLVLDVHRYARMLSDQCRRLRSGGDVAAQQHALGVFRKLDEIRAHLAGTSFVQLAELASVRVKESREHLFKLFSEQFTAACKKAKWVGSSKVLPSTNLDDLRDFQMSFKSLVQLQGPLLDVAITPDMTDESLHATLPRLTAMGQMGDIVGRDFRFHFMTDRETNNVTKPEWYFTYCLGLVRDRTPFLCNVVQPLLNDCQLQIYDAKVEFIKEIIRLVSSKLWSFFDRADMKELMARLETRQHRDQVSDMMYVLIHTVNEALVFDHALNVIHGYPLAAPVAAAVVQVPKHLSVWEHATLISFKQDCQTKIDEPQAWAPYFADVPLGEKDIYRQTNIADAFALMLTSLTDRYRSLASIPARLHFFQHVHSKAIEMVMYFMDDEVAAIRTKPAFGQLEHLQHACLVLNSIDYIRQALFRLSLTLFFVELSAFQSTHADETMLWQASPTLFDDHLSDYERLGGDLAELIVAGVQQAIMAHLRPYLDTVMWSSSLRSAQVDAALPSEQLGAAVQYFATALALMDRSLSLDRFPGVWKQLVRGLDETLLRRLVLQRKFDAVGAAQLAVDVAALARPLENYSAVVADTFPKLKSAVLLLNYATPSESGENTAARHYLLCETLAKEGNTPVAQAALAAVGVERLSVTEARDILRSHRNWPEGL